MFFISSIVNCLSSLLSKHWDKHGSDKGGSDKHWDIGITAADGAIIREILPRNVCVCADCVLPHLDVEGAVTHRVE